MNSSPPATADRFESAVSSTIDDVTKQRMGASWRPGCPTPLDELRLLKVTHWGFDGRPRTGELVVAAGFADDVVTVFRRLMGSTRWSEHAYGRAIDINPIQNPYVTRSGAVLPPAGAVHTARYPASSGLITRDGPVVAAFRDISWRWGGNWTSGKDYQHFSATGR